MYQEIPMPCPNCQKPIAVAVQAHPSLANTNGVSLVILEHIPVVRCTTCNIDLRPILVAVGGLTLNLVKVEPPQDRRIIVPGLAMGGPN